MIRPADGEDVRQVLDRAVRVPDRYREVVVCSGFFDETGGEWLDRVSTAVHGAGRRLTVLKPSRTRLPGSGDEFSRDGSLDSRRIHSVPRLHAKVYVLLGVDGRDHEAVVTSANLTQAGLFRNREVGLRLRGSSPELSRLIERVARRPHAEACTPRGGN